MKKLVIIGAVGLALVLGFNALNNNSDSPTDQADNDVFVKYDNTLLSDRDGIWMLIKNGKIYGISSEAAFYAWQQNNPDRTLATKVPESIWNLYAGTDRYAGNFTATT